MFWLMVFSDYFTKQNEVTILNYQFLLMLFVLFHFTDELVKWLGRLPLMPFSSHTKD